VVGNLGCTWNKGRRNDRRKGKKLGRSTISTNIVLVGSELTTLCGDSLEVLLGRSVGIANLQKKTFLANWLAMELSDDLLTDLTTLETTHN
jgi:hypothetical protein